MILVFVVFSGVLDYNFIRSCSRTGGTAKIFSSLSGLGNRIEFVAETERRLYDGEHI